MREQWFSVAEAAERLDVSERTVWRRVGKGAYRTRMTPDGRREVLLTPPDGTSAVLSVVEDQAERGLQAAGAAVQRADRLAEHLAAEVRTARRSARLAWVLVAVLVLAGGLVGWHGVRTSTRTEARAETAEATADNLADRLADAQADRDRLAAEVLTLTADLAGARTRLELAEAPAPTTRPTAEAPTTQPTRTALAGE